MNPFLPSSFVVVYVFYFFLEKEKQEPPPFSPYSFLDGFLHLGSRFYFNYRVLTDLPYVIVFGKKSYIIIFFLIVKRIDFEPVRSETPRPQVSTSKQTQTRHKEKRRTLSRTWAL